MVLTMARRPMVATRDHTFLHTRKPKPKCARSLTLAGAPGHPRRPVQPIPCLRSLGRDRPGQPCEWSLSVKLYHPDVHGIRRRRKLLVQLYEDGSADRRITVQTYDESRLQRPAA